MTACQKDKHFLQFDTEEQEVWFENKGGDVLIPVNTNLDIYEFRFGESSWLNGKVTSEGIVLTADPNPSVENRKNTLRIVSMKYPELNKSISIIQEGVFLRILPESVPQIPLEGGELTVTIETNLDDWTYRIEDANWLSGTLNSNSIVLEATPYNDAFARVANLIIESPSFPSLNKAVNIIQKGTGGTGVYAAGSIIITGFLANPKGADAPAEDTAPPASDVNFFNPLRGDKKHSGPYEYIQCMALERINFEETPYALVTTRNGQHATSPLYAPVNANGWATGGNQSFKFNLTQGVVEKGEFFYVGGTSQALNGYENCTVVVNPKKWIRTIAYNNVGATGDGFGIRTDGLFSNLGEADLTVVGIALFEGTNVTSTTVPIDAVFYGRSQNLTEGNKNKIYHAANDWGYLIPKTDWYDPMDGVQPRFWQGTNIKYINNLPTAESEYTMLGGIIDSNKQWVIPREASFKSMMPCRPTTYTVADIESGVGVTQMIDQ